MWEIIWKVFVTFLIIYFVFDVIEKTVTFTINDKKKQRAIIVKVRNRASDIEGVIRGLVWRCLKESFGGFIPYIIVIDMGCEDETMDIVRRLSNEYSFLIPMTLDEYEQIRRE